MNTNDKLEVAENQITNIGQQLEKAQRQAAELAVLLDKAKEAMTSVLDVLNLVKDEIVGKPGPDCSILDRIDKERTRLKALMGDAA